MTTTLSHRRAALPTPAVGSPDAVAAIATAIGFDLTPCQRRVIDLAYSPLTDINDPRLTEAHIQALASLGSAIASLPEIRAEVLQEMRLELDIVGLETSVMLWAGLTPGLTWADVSDRGCRYLALASLAAADDEDLSFLSRLALAMADALLRGWSARLTQAGGTR
jgi:hypothetical protein